MRIYRSTDYIFDITDEKLEKKKVNTIFEERGEIYFLVHNASIVKRDLVSTKPIDEFRSVIEVDLVSLVSAFKRHN
ncbi:MAG: hypothetical protein HKN31_09925 [Pricia sp.]|nr:hypothetical protein [Pricia sp.]